ncbi:hypothetical protein ACFX1X_034045 [Malus domestica]
MATFYAGLYPSRALVKNQLLFQFFEVFNAAGFFIFIWMMKILSRGSPFEFTLKPFLPLLCLVYILGVAKMFSCSCCTWRIKGRGTPLGLFSDDTVAMALAPETKEAEAHSTEQGGTVSIMQH